MDREIGGYKESEITSENVISSIESISKSDWEGANYPIISFASRKLLDLEYQKEGSNNIEFWKEVLNIRHFFRSNYSAKFNSETDFLFIVHTFKDSKGEETVIKAITTTPESFVVDPGNMINYHRHGFPCENRGGSEYPTLKDFWRDFYDRLPTDDLDKYPLPTRDWRKRHIHDKL